MESPVELTSPSANITASSEQPEEPGQIHGQDGGIEDDAPLFGTHEAHDGACHWVYEIPPSGSENAMTIDIVCAPDDVIEYYSASFTKNGERTPFQILPLNSADLTFDDLNADGYNDIRESYTDVWIWNPSIKQFEFEPLLYWKASERTSLMYPSEQADEDDERFLHSYTIEYELHEEQPEAKLVATLDSFGPFSLDGGYDYMYRVDVYEKSSDRDPISTFDYVTSSYGGSQPEFADLNGDGFNDICITWFYGSSGGNFTYYLWNPITKLYTPGFYDSGHRCLLGNDIVTIYEHASVVSGEDKMYKWFGNSLRKVRVLWHDYGVGENATPSFVVTDYPNGKGQGVEIYNGSDEEVANAVYRSGYLRD